jgi:hypothetical protein
VQTNALIAIIAVVVAVIVIGAAVYFKKRRTRMLRQQFGPEYERVVRERGDESRAEAELQKRERRIAKLEIRPLSEQVRENYADRWREVQRRFVDDPRGTVVAADQLVAEVMSARGYPVGDFEQRAADISVHYPRLVENYRGAHEIVLRHRKGEAGTEDLRKAMVYYRALFAELLEASQPGQREVA